MCCCYTVCAVNKLAIILLTLIKRPLYAQKLCCLTVVPRLLEALVELLKPIERLLTIKQQASCGTIMALMWLISGNTTAGMSL